MRNRRLVVEGLALAALLLAGCDSGADVAGGQSGEAKSLTLAERCEARRAERKGNRVVNGKPAKPGSAPWQAEIFSPPRYTEEDRAFDSTLEDGDECKVYLDQRQNFELQHQCGGSYIGDGWVITAAHCVVNVRGFDAPDDMIADASGEMVRNPRNAIKYRTIRLGTQNLTAGGGEFEIDSIVIHGDYVNAAKLHDIALIKLKEDDRISGLEEEDRLKPIPLARSTDRDFDEGENLRVTGWGWMGHRDASAMVTRLDGNDEVQRNPSELQQLSVRYQPDEVCKQEYGDLYGPGSLCAGSLDPEAQEGTCQGDSGGPLTRQDDAGRVLVGLVSFAKGCASGKPVVYTRVSHYDRWIDTAKAAARPGEVVNFTLP